MDHIEIFIDEKRLSSSQGTIELYSLVLRKFQEHMGKPIGQATRHDIVRYLNHIIFERKLEGDPRPSPQYIKSFFPSCQETSTCLRIPRKHKPLGR